MKNPNKVSYSVEYYPYLDGAQYYPFNAALWSFTCSAHGISQVKHLLTRPTARQIRKWVKDIKAEGKVVLGLSDGFVGASPTGRLPVSMGNPEMQGVVLVDGYEPEPMMDCDYAKVEQRVMATIESRKGKSFGLPKQLLGRADRTVTGSFKNCPRQMNTQMSNATITGKHADVMIIDDEVIPVFRKGK